MDLETFKIHNYNDNIINRLIENNIDIDYCCKKNDLIVEARSEDLKKIENIEYKKIEEDKNILLLRNSIKSRRSIASLGQYHFQEDLKLFLNKTVNNYKQITTLEIIGKSVENRDLYVMKISGKSYITKSKSSIMILGNIHGNETIGREICLFLIRYLTFEYYNNNKYVRKLVDNTNIYIMPSLNPDGFEYTKSGVWAPRRTNANNVDLNRNFPDQFIKTDNIMQPETKSMIDFYKKNQIHISLSIHSGSIVVNYPFDGPTSKQYSATKDDKFFNYISREYANNVDYFKRSSFKDGIINGAEWYALFGGLQDWRYVFNNGYELTIELSNEKIIEEKYLKYFWEKNKKALIRIIEIANTGIEIVNISNFKMQNQDSKREDIATNNYLNVIPGKYLVMIEEKNHNAIINIEESTKIYLKFENNKLRLVKKEMFKLESNNNIRSLVDHFRRFYFFKIKN